SQSCTPCQAGYYCPYQDSDQDLPCLSGTFAVGGKHVCTDCPAGFTCRYFRAYISTSTNQMEACGPGYFSLLGEPLCTTCPAGYRCPLAKDSPIACDPGYYRYVRENPSYACGSASTTSAPNVPTAALSAIPFPFSDVFLHGAPRDGASSTAASTNCTSCPAGYFCDDPEALPQPCEVGYYSGGGTAVCSACQPGYRCPEASVSATPAGSECPEGTYCNPARTLLECPAGT
ncbi:unnamed protein product, partial [Ectocarpus sp. 12 AP-2014]